MATTWEGPVRFLRTTVPVAFLLLVSLAALALPAHGATPGGLPLNASMSGPTSVGAGLKASYTIHASGGPAEAPNGTQVGTYTYSASLTAVNTTGASVNQRAGVLVNGSVVVQFQAPNVTEPLTIYVLVTSELGTTNTSQNVSYSVQIVQPYDVRATLLVGSSSGVTSFDLTVTLDGSAVGSIKVPSLSAGTSYPLSFAYVPSGLSPGWHTFAISLAQEHGLVAFVGGQTTFSTSFYVTGGATDYSWWYLAGASAFFGAIFIWSTRVGGRRRARPKK